jgi:hypothetical protein
MTPISKIHFCIQYLRDTIHDVMPAREVEEDGDDDYETHMKFETRQERFL